MHCFNIVMNGIRPSPSKSLPIGFFFVDVIKTSAREHGQIKERIKNIFDCLPQDKSYSFIILSSLAVYGQVPGRVTEETPPRPDTLTGRLADDIETFFIEQFLSKRKHSLKMKAAILRLGTLSAEGEGTEEQADAYGKIDTCKAARLIIASASIQHEGLEVLQFAVLR
ncbi:hypothetical protein QS257_15195 [Terrilactibacillus sp. S3-3]|nr:hypothetical protein QS257_15195 [Terrilactibacillus sp. S3-3]